MAETHGFVRLPPDSTGKRIPHSVMVEIMYDTGTIQINEGDVLSFDTSGIIGTAVDVSGSVSGELHLLLDEPVNNGVAAIVGENIRVGGVVVAKAATTGYPFFYQHMLLAGGKHIVNTIDVDDVGAASVRFAEGSPQFDAFGKMQVSESHTLGDYVLRYDSEPSQFEDTIVGGSSTLTHNPDFSGITLSIGTTAGDIIQRMSHEYHLYQPGVSQLVEMTVAVGDSGKANVVRQWGYGDTKNGMGFRLNGTTLEIVQRSSASGVTVDVAVPQSQWNGDRLNGSHGLDNISGLTLDVTTDNIYWVDFQWLGAGRVRFGVIINGVRITCHSNHNANTGPYSYMGTGSLPVHVATYNTGTSVSTSEIKFFCSTVKTEGAYIPLRRLYAASTPALVAVTDTAIDVMGLRPIQIFKTLDNRCSIYPQTFELFNAGTNAVVLEVMSNAVETSGTWNQLDSDSASEVSFNTVTTGGRSLKTVVIPGGATHTINFDSFVNNRQGLRRNATVSTGYTAQYYRVRALVSGQTSNVFLSVEWEEIRK